MRSPNLSEDQPGSLDWIGSGRPGLAAGSLFPLLGQGAVPEDVIPTAAGDLAIGFVGHGTLVFRFAGKVIHVDPWSRAADYTRLPKADLILVTHDHGDHLDPKAIAAIRTDGTRIVVSRSCAGKVDGAVVMANGATRTEAGFRIEAVPAYDVAHRRPNGEAYHPTGAGNGHVITFGDRRVYVAGDTENTPEMKALNDIDVAFLPMNLPYTMTPPLARVPFTWRRPAAPRSRARPPSSCRRFRCGSC